MTIHDECATQKGRNKRILLAFKFKTSGHFRVASQDVSPPPEIFTKQTPEFLKVNKTFLRSAISASAAEVWKSLVGILDLRLIPFAEEAPFYPQVSHANLVCLLQLRIHAQWSSSVSALLRWQCRLVGHTSVAAPIPRDQRWKTDTGVPEILGS